MSGNMSLVPPFTRETAIERVKYSEDAWNSASPDKVIEGYAADCQWRGRSKFLQGHEAIVTHLTQKWQSEKDYRIIKELWAFCDTHLAVRFQYEWHNDSGLWFRSCGIELWEFNDEGKIRRREASINDVLISDEERRFLWPKGPRPDDYPGLLSLGL